MSDLIRVSYSRQGLGSGVFWEGSPLNVREIRNIPARQMAERVVVDGVTRTGGMWKVERVEGEGHE
jgi:homospermidine synthase